ncbi:S-adenosylmethionine synthetase [Flammeovirgaceae bacterium 311]|nr:S-adenosylmethionine synthetase [Flammeovirgaceae bacterium 311]
MSYLFTSESVSEGHPDKIADQISDAILDAMLAQDPDSRVACETFVTTGLVVVGGEVTTKAYVEIPEVVRETIKRIGYNKDDYKFDAESCGVMVTLHSQSPDIARGVDADSDKDQGAGDQGMMFGYATTETPEYMPMALAFSHRLVKDLAEIRKNSPALMPYLRPDSKAQVTIEYTNEGTPKRVHTVVISTQHDAFMQPKDSSAAAQAEADRQMLEKIRVDIIEHVIRKAIPANMLDDNTIFHVNPTGKFVIGGPHGDAGLTGRKIIVDTYGGKGAHGGGAFSGKDSSKVDRSAAYAARHIAKNLVAAGVTDEALVQVAYAIGVAQPVSLNVNTYGKSKVNMNDAEISNVISKLFDMRPKAIVERFGLKNPIFGLTAAYGHMGRSAYTQEVELNTVEVKDNGEEKHQVHRRVKKQLEFFSWEKLDYVDKIKDAFGLK